MLYWTRFPFIRIAMFYISGILMYPLINVSFDILSLITGVFLFLYILLNRFLRKKLFYYHQYLLTCLIFLILFVLGLLRIEVHNPLNDPDHWMHYNKDITFFVARINNDEGQTSNYLRYSAQMILFHDEKSWNPTKGKILLYGPPGFSCEPGDVVLVKGGPQGIDPPALPGQFDYRKFLERKRIYGVRFLKENEIHQLSYDHPGFVPRIAYQTKKRITQIITESQSDEHVRSILIALLTGERGKIDPDTYETFINVGVVHILAVSGLHVGIIYMICLLLLKPAGNKSLGRIFRLVFILSVLLIFVFITGLAPSVLRASIMFSIMLLGKTLQRNSHAINTVFLSSFLLLMIDPNLIYDVGFQLSYSAVLGIILFQPILVKFWIPDNQISDWVWKITTVSLAAQISTLPITLYYFKQFPTYFLISNLVAIPYASLVIPLGLAIIPLHYSGFFNYILSTVLNHCTSLFILCMETVASIPGSLITPINIDIPDVLLISLILILIYIILNQRKWRLLYICFLLIFPIISVDAVSYYRALSEKKIIKYNLQGLFCFELIDGNSGILIVGSASENTEKRIRYYTDNFCNNHNHPSRFLALDQVFDVFPGFISNGHRFISWNNLLICIQNKAVLPSERINIQPCPDLIITPDLLKYNVDRENIEIKENKISNFKYVTGKGYTGISWNEK